MQIKTCLLRQGPQEDKVVRRVAMWSLWLNLWFNISVERYTNNLHISSTPKSRWGSSDCAPLITERHFAYTSEILEPERRQLMTVAKQPWSHPFGVLIKTRKKMWPDAWLGAQCKPEASFKVRVPSAPFATFISGFFFFFLLVNKKELTHSAPLLLHVLLSNGRLQSSALPHPHPI